MEADFSDAELDDAMQVGLIVGGSIVIPHLRRAVDLRDLLGMREDEEDSSKNLR